MSNFIEKRDYQLIDILEDESDALNGLSEFSESMYICDVITELADSFIPIYTNDIWKNAYDIEEYIEDAISSGIADTSSREFSLTRIFQAGYYTYYSQSLYQNLETVVFNMIAERVNEHLKTVNNMSDINIEDLESQIESESSLIDNNNRISDIFNIAHNIIEMIKDGEFIS